MSSTGRRNHCQHERDPYLWYLSRSLSGPSQYLTGARVGGFERSQSEDGAAGGDIQSKPRGLPSAEQDRMKAEDYVFLERVRIIETSSPLSLHLPKRNANCGFKPLVPWLPFTRKPGCPPSKAFQVRHQAWERGYVTNSFWIPPASMQTYLMHLLP